MEGRGRGGEGKQRTRRQLSASRRPWGPLSLERPPHIPPFQDLSVSSPFSHHWTIFAACFHFCRLVGLLTSADIFLSCLLCWKLCWRRIFLNRGWPNSSTVTFRFSYFPNSESSQFSNTLMVQATRLGWHEALIHIWGPSLLLRFFWYSESRFKDHEIPILRT